METLKFKTNIKCTGCIARATPVLNEEKQIENWEVDIYGPSKVLTVTTANMTPEQVIDTVKKAGFEAELIKQQ
jgi:copper chaperone